MSKKILILIGGHLSSAPRPLKEAIILSQAGYDITVAGCWFVPRLIARDKELARSVPFDFVRYADFSRNSPLSHFLIRARRWLALRSSMFPGSCFGYATEEMLKLALHLKANLTIAHSEAGLWVAGKLVSRNFRIGVDFEDWYSEQADMRQNVKCQQNLKAMESYIINRASYRLAASESMGQALRESYKLQHPPAIAYNVFPADHSTWGNTYVDRVATTVPSLLWFSQTIAPGRGLELLMQSLDHIHQPLEIHLRGDDLSGFSRGLLEMAPLRHKPNVYFHSTVSMNELPILIREHDIGLALDLPNCRNYDLTVTNKVFQYLSAGLPVIATKTCGQQEVAKYFPNRIYLLGENTSFELANAITTILTGSGWKSPLSTATDNVIDERISYEGLKNTLVAEAESALA